MAAPKIELPVGEGTRELKEHIQARIDELRDELEDTRNNESMTAAIRGRIGELRDLLDRCRFGGA